MNRQMTNLQYFAYENHIKEFVHFTNERNLLSILCRGVLSRKVLQENNIPFEYNDEKRLDGMLDAVSLSVTAPNYLMFYKYRALKEKSNWVVITFDSQKILEYKCSFYRANAACMDSCQFKKEERQNVNSFEEMFSDWDPYHNRWSLDLGSNETTNPQAEVMVFDAIPISCISRIVFQNERLLKKYTPLLVKLGITSVYGKYFFSPRRDYKYWTKTA